MDKLNKILKNVLVFLVVFLTLNYIFSSCQNNEEKLTENAGNFIFVTDDSNYSRNKTINLKITNNTQNTILIPDECPNEPFDIYRYENNEWVQKSVSPELDCSETKEKALAPGEELQVSYDKWNHALFSEMGRFRIQFETKIDEEEKIFTSNEFIVKEEGLFSKLWMGLFYRPIYNALIFLTVVAPYHSLGFAIILLTIIIRTILLVPSHKAMRSQKKMQDIQPRLEKIKEKYKGDQQKIASETMALWKESKVNPFGSCLPLLLQFPFLIAVFYAIQSGLNPDNTYLLYTQYADFSLADIEVNFLNILDLTKVNFYVLPLVVGGLQFIQMKLAMNKMNKKGKEKSKEKDKKEISKKGNEMAMATSMMTYIMPVMIAVFTASLPAGVGLYWGTSTLYGIIQQVFINREKPGKNDEPTVKVIEPKEKK